MYKYRPLISGSFYVRHKGVGYTYSIDIPVPLEFDCAEDAIHSNVFARFEKRGDDVALVIRRSEGHLGGPVEEIDTILWKDYTKYRNVAREREHEDAMLPDSTPWNELFDKDMFDDNGAAVSVDPSCICLECFPEPANMLNDLDFAKRLDWRQYTIRELQFNSIPSTEHIRDLLDELANNEHNIIDVVVDRIVEEKFPIGGYGIDYIGQLAECEGHGYSPNVKAGDHVIDIIKNAPFRKDQLAFRMVIGDDVRLYFFNADTYSFVEAKTIRDALYVIPEL
jgi:hypothetical protein